MQLEQGGEIVATALLVPNSGLIVDMPNAQITVRRGGIDPRAPMLERLMKIGFGTTVVDERDGRIIGRAPLALTKRVTLDDGTQYVWRPNFTASRHTYITNDSHEPVVRFRSHFVLFRSSGTIRVLQPISALHAHCLIALGWWWVAAAHF
jgi:hypothetical protein